MKKYVKPELFYENFQLSNGVANCNVEFDNKNMASKDACYVTYAGTDIKIFNGSKCDYPSEDYCITNGSDVFCLLNS